MTTLARYIKGRYVQKSRGWGKPWVRWLWLDALLFGVTRWATLNSPWFRRWCREVDRLFRVDFDFSFDLTEGSGRDCWIDAYWDRLSPQEAVDSEVSHWEE